MGLLNPPGVTPESKARSKPEIHLALLMKGTTENGINKDAISCCLRAVWSPYIVDKGYIGHSAHKTVATEKAKASRKCASPPSSSHLPVLLDGVNMAIVNGFVLFNLFFFFPHYLCQLLFVVLFYSPKHLQACDL